MWENKSEGGGKAIESEFQLTDNISIVSASRGSTREERREERREKVGRSSISVAAAAAPSDTKTLITIWVLKKKKKKKVQAENETIREMLLLSPSLTN